jgi:YD repeat-containing protein
MKIRKLHDPNSVVLLDGGNRVLTYTYDPNSEPNEPRYNAPPGKYEYILENQDGTYTLVKKHGTELDFDINGNLTSIVHRNGGQITFTYDPNGLMPLNGPSDYFVDQNYGLVAMEYRLTKITDDLGREIELSYDANGLLSTITDFANRTWTYTHDANNNLVGVTSPSTDEFPSGLTTSYTYDVNHNMLTATDANGQVYLAHIYDSNDRVYQQTYGNGTYTFNYDPDNNSVTVTDRKGYDVTSVYKDTGQLLKEIVHTDGLRPGDPSSYITEFEYDNNLEVTRKYLPGGNYIDYTYDNIGNLLKVVQEPNNGEPNIVTEFTYDPNFSFVKTVKDPLGNITTYDYDIYGNLIKVTYPSVDDNTPTVEYTYNYYGQVETKIALDGIITKYLYYTDANDANNYGRLWKLIVDANESDPSRLEITTTYKYDTLGRIIEITDPNGNTTIFEYNNLNQLIETTAPLPFNYVTNYAYNYANITFLIKLRSQLIHWAM